jgi:dTDP-4-amino-4,6-dideoxygalactose transaminase
MIGAVPVLIDVAEDTCCMDMSLVERTITPATKAIIVVHLYGHPADLNALPRVVRDRGIVVIEDCAQAQGGTYSGRPLGSIGELSCFSFYPTKNLGAIGDGGAVCTSDEAVLQRLRELRAYGWTKPQYSTREYGRCTRLDEIQAAVLAIKLEALESFVETRRALAKRYCEGLQDLPLILPTEKTGCRHAYHLFVIRTERRNELEAHLTEHGVGTGRHYPFPIHVQPGLMAKARVATPMPVTERLSNEILSLPLYVTLSFEQQDRVIATVRQFFNVNRGA